MELLSIDLDVVLELLELRIDRRAEVHRGVGLNPVLNLRMTLAQVVALNLSQIAHLLCHHPVVIN